MSSDWTGEVPSANIKEVVKIEFKFISSYTNNHYTVAVFMKLNLKH